MYSRDMEQEKKKAEERMDKSELMVRMLAGIVTNGQDYPALAIKDLDIKKVMENIEEQASKDEKLCIRAIGLYQQIENILKDFIKDNNINDNKTKDDLTGLFNLL